MRARILFIYLLFFTTLQAQEYLFKTNTVRDMVVCGEAVVHKYTYINYSGSDLANQAFHLVTPAGINYATGSLVNNGTHSIQESGFSGDTAFFQVPQLPNGDSIQFFMSFQADVQSIAYQNQGNIFRNTFSFGENSDIHVFESDSYNILAAALSILYYNPYTQTVLSGSEVNRAFKIVNAGNGSLNEFYLTIDNEAGLTTTAISHGTLNATGDTVFLAGADFLSIGNQDSIFDTNESIILTETVEGFTCEDITASTELTAFWGCKDEAISSITKHSNVRIEFNNPNFSISGTESLSSCFTTGDPSEQSLRIINTGTGMASSIKLELFKASGSSYSQAVLSKIDTASLGYKTSSGADFQSVNILSSVISNNSGEYSCLGESPIGKVLIQLPDMMPQDTLWLEWDMISCCIESCNNMKVKGWRSKLTYSDICSNSSYTKNYTGQGNNEQSMALFTETKPDITAGQSYEFNYRITSFKNTLPVGNGAYYEMNLELDNGLVLDGLNFTKNGQDWTPSYTHYTNGQNIWTYRFDLPEVFSLALSDIQLNISGDCGSSGWKDIKLNVSYIPDNSCTDCKIPLACDITTDTYLHCPGSVCNGVSFYKFDVERKNLGQPDNNSDGLADASGILDLQKLKRNRMMVLDTFETVFYGAVHAQGNNTGWDYAYAASSIEDGKALNVTAAELYIYDASASQQYTLDSIVYTKEISGNTASFLFNLSVDSLEQYNSDLVSYSYSDGDTMLFKVKYVVSDNLNFTIKEVTSENELYLSNVENPSTNQKAFCDFRNGRYTLINYDFTNSSSSNYTVNSCSKVIQQDFSFKIGGLRLGGNFFPYEYRNWAHIKTAEFIVPEDYTLVNSQFWAYRTKSAGTSQLQKVNNINPDIISSDTLIYNLDQYYTNGQVKKSTGGFYGRMRVEIAPVCDAETNVYKDIPWSGAFSKSDIFGATDTLLLNSSPDRVRYLPSTLALSSNNPKMDSYDQTVEWHLKITNSSSSDADYSWINIASESNIWIEKIVDQSTGDTLVKVSDIFQVGTVGKNKSKNYTIFGRFNNCNSNSITVNTGYQCDGYPADFQSFTCGYVSLNLYQYPAASEMQVLLFNDTDNSSVCSPVVELGWEIASVNLANIYDMSVSVFTTDTNSIRLENDSSLFQYNLNNNYQAVPNPSISGNQYLFDIDDYSGTIDVNGMPGSMDLTNNRLRLKSKFSLGSAFNVGDFILMTIRAKNACGEDLPNILLAYDPNSKFSVDNISGISLDQGEHWSAAWGDFNGDGYDDLFVPEYGASKGSLLYQNNGDGTFTKLTDLNISTDLGSAVSGTWADYDNDGKLDLFVSYNSNSQDKLYRNLGDGTFESIENDPIVENGIYSHGAAWADYDRDGYLDMAVSDYWSTQFNELYHNNGDGSFSAVPTSPVTMHAGSSVSLSWADFDNDNDPDLFVANSNGENNILYINQNGTFIPMENDILVQDGGKSIGGSWGDYDNDGDLDIYVTNAGELEYNALYENNGDGSFQKIESGIITNLRGSSHGASWIDYDNDGDLDLLVANDQNQENWLFANNNDKTFTRLHNAITQEAAHSYGLAWADADMDGDHDLFIANKQNSTNDFFWNDKGACKSYLGIKLIGGISNRNGIGARIRVKAIIQGVSTWQTREVSSQNNGGPGGQNSLNTLFGLDEASIVDSIEVRWPSGIVQKLSNQVINQYITITEAPGAKVCGYVFYDENENGIQDSTETGLSGMSILLSPGNHQLFSNSEGYFQAYLADGAYQISMDDTGLWNQISPVNDYSVTVNHNYGTDYCDFAFGMSPICQGAELSAQIQATAFKRGFENECKILLENKGVSNAYNLNMQLIFSGDISLAGIDWESTYTDDGSIAYSWSLDSFPALSDTLFELSNYVDLNAELDSMASIQVILTSSNIDCDSSNNESIYTDLIVGSIDPNDKAVFVNKGSLQSYISTEDTLHYRIRFQNIGNYPATIVRIIDTLDAGLDPRTVQLESCTHPFNFNIQEGNVLVWENNSINLVDSFTDPEGSNGQVIFSVRPHKDLTPGTRIENTASIQFDFNEPLVTNTTYSVLRKAKYSNSNLIAEIYPNPANQYTSIRVLDKNIDMQPVTIQSVRVLDLHGRLLEFYDMNTLEYTLNCESMDAGVYILEIRDEVGRLAHAKLNKYK